MDAMAVDLHTSLRSGRKGLTRRCRPRQSPASPASPVSHRSIQAPSIDPQHAALLTGGRARRGISREREM